MHINAHLSLFRAHSHVPGEGKLIRKREERNRLELECHLSLQRWDDAVRLLTAMLRENPDHWKDIEVYISCQIERYKESVREAKEEHEMKKRGREGSRGCEEEEGRTECEEEEGRRGCEEEEEGEERRGCEEGEGGARKEEVWEGKGEKEEEEGLNQVNEGESENERLIPRSVEIVFT